MPTLNLGKVRFALQGTWDSATAYAILDAVLYNGSTYTAIAASAAGTVPSSNAAIWQLLAEKGTNGNDGTDGNDGTNGTTFTAGTGLTLSGTTLNCDINTPGEVGLSYLSNNGRAYFAGKYCDIVGRISMDMTVVDVDDLDVVEGDWFELMGAQISVDEVARQAQTITFEVFTGLSPRLTRVYIED